MHSGLARWVGMFGNYMFYKSNRQPARPCTPVRFRPPPPSPFTRYPCRASARPGGGMVYTADLKSAAVWHAGSTPAPGTILCTNIIPNGTHLLAPECARQAGAQAVGIRTRARQERPYAARRYAAH